MRRLYSIGKWARIASTLTALCLVSHSSIAYAETILGLEPELALKYFYQKAKSHKAMAIGPAGIWVYHEGAPSAKAAVSFALRECQKTVVKRNWTEDGKCELVAVDKKIVWTKPSVGPPIDVALPLPDLPLAKAKMFAPQQGEPKGIVLALHGSEDSYGVSNAPYLFQKSWFDYFNSIGMLVIFPSAFDDVIPAYGYESWNDPITYQVVTSMQKLRLAQTKRTISVLKKQYPGLPIYLWTHSAGGNLAQAIDRDIAGAIIVSTRCGIGSPALNFIPRDVPVMYVFGETDPKIIRGSSRLTMSDIKSICGKAYGGKNRKLVLAQNADHLVPIWRQNVLDIVAQFFNQSSFSLANPKSRFELSDAAKKAFEKTYQTTPLKKAFAVGKSGYGFSASLQDQNEANIEALLKCNRATTGLSYPESGKHECSLYAVGNKINY